MANYFSYLPNIRVGVPETNSSIKNYIITKNIFRRVKAQSQFLRNLTYFEKFTIPGDDKPYTVSYNVYDTPKYEWIILLVNDIVNLYSEWPLSRPEFEYSIKTKYGTKDHEIHHYETKEILDSDGNIILPKGIIVNSNFSKRINRFILSGEQLLKSVSNYEFEEKINEEKREIYLPYPSTISTIENELVTLLQYDPSKDIIDDMSHTKNSGDDDFYSFKYFSKGISI
jgi:hypothetical protein